MKNGNGNSADVKTLDSRELFVNRELSLIEFQRRVLEEAADERHPLLERLKFVSIFSSNLDEFFLIRVAGLKRQTSAGVVDLSMDGMTPQEQLEEIRERLLPLYAVQERILIKEIFPALEKEGIVFRDFKKLNKKDKKKLQSYFERSVLPLLTPLMLDSAHPFPRFVNRGLNIAFVLEDEFGGASSKKIAFLQLPSILKRFVPLDRKTGNHFVLVEQIIKAHADILFPGMKVIASNAFKVTRDADVEIAEDEAEDLLTEIAEQVKQRRWGTAVVRLEVNSKMPDYLVEFLMQSLELEPSDVYVHDRPLHLPDFMQLRKLGVRKLVDKPFQTRPLPGFQVEGVSVFDAMRKRDMLVHHPFDSFTNSVLKFIRTASDDENVLAIKITLYRTGSNSPIVAALKNAAEKGKSVTAFVELKARFDEENNIIWAKELEQTGVHVVYGILGLKTHCKICMVIRREGDELRPYLHLSTGNYNHITARLYTDVGLLTSNPKFGVEAIHLFNYLTGYSRFEDWKEFLVAPVNLRDKIIEFIDREAEKHTPDNPGLIFAKMNSIAHADVGKALYRASQAGVEVRLIVRGVCCLRPGIEGLSENIEVRSILGRFLEHTRVFYFKNGGDEEIYLSSADWMTRNLHKRVELMFPIYAEDLKTRLKELLDIYWMDNCKSRRLLADGSYESLSPAAGEDEFIAQDYFLEEIKGAKKKIMGI